MDAATLGEGVTSASHPEFTAEELNCLRLMKRRAKELEFGTMPVFCKVHRGKIVNVRMKYLVQQVNLDDLKESA